MTCPFLPRHLSHVFLLSVALLTAFAVAQSAPSTVQFYNGGRRSVGESTHAVAIANIDLDGRNDRVVVNGNELTIDFGYDVEIYPVGDSPNQIVVNDFNHDGWPDIAVNNSGSSFITILMQLAGGTMHETAAITFPGRPNGIAVGDFNGDRFADLAAITCTDTACKLRIFYYQPGDTFRAGQVIALPGARNLYKSLIVASDVNRDGLLDISLIADNRKLITYVSSGPKFNIRSWVTLPDAATATALAWGNFDANRAPDLVVRGILGCGSSCSDRNSDYVYLNDGGGTFSRKVNLYDTNSRRGGFVAAGDINGDTFQDLVTLAADVSNPQLMYRLGDGNGNFSKIHYITTAPGDPNAVGVYTAPTGLQIVDMNRDGRKDIEYSGYDELGNDQAGDFLRVNKNAIVECNDVGPGQLFAYICGIAPVEGGILMLASGNSPLGVIRMETWLNGKKAYETWNNEIAKTLPVPPGTYSIYFVAVDLTGDTVRSSEHVVVVP